MPIAEAIEWTPSFTHGVLAAWKNCAAYCNALLRYNERINLDDLPSGVRVDDAARALAKQQLAVKAAKRAKEAARIPPTPEPTPAQVLVAPSAPEPEPHIVVIETPEQLRAHLRRTASIER